MPRYFHPITQFELNNKIDECEDANVKHLSPQVRKDLEKVEFGTENIDECYGAWSNTPKGIKSLGGYQTLDNGFTFYGQMAGGDWENPIFFLIYWDGKQLRGYIPEKGNTWNTITKQAMGNDTDADAKFLCKLNGKKYNPDEDYGDLLANGLHMIPDYALILQDIKDRILPANVVILKKATATNIKTGKAVKKALTSPKTLKMVFDSMDRDDKDDGDDLDTCDIGKKVASTTFYSCGDEGYELWQTMCHLCYQLVGLAHDDKARVVLKWIVESAEDSRTWSIEQYGSLDETDSETGYWG